MKIKTYFYLASIAFAASHVQAQEMKSAVQSTNGNVTKNQNIDDQRLSKMESIYDFTVKDINGNDFSFAGLKGKKVMIVNTASQCGLTPQYKELEALYQKYKDLGLVIIGFPSNDFKGQEPGSNQEIAAFCEKNYGVKFPMMSKISVTGEDMATIYKYLTQKRYNNLQDSEVEWNFQKYLLDESGHLVKVISPKTSPMDESIINWLKS